MEEHAVPSLPLRLLPASGSGLHAACGRRGEEHNDKQDRKRHKSHNVLTHLTPLPRPRSALTTNSTTLARKLWTQPAVRPRSACTTLGEHPEAYVGDLTVQNILCDVAFYEECRGRAELDVSGQRQRKWDVEKSILEEANARSRARCRAAQRKMQQTREGLRRAKRQTALEHLNVAAEEAYLRRAIESESSRLRRRIAYQRWDGGVVLETEFLTAACIAGELSNRTSIITEEHCTFETLLRKSIIKCALHEMSTNGEAERDKLLKLQRLLERRRRFVADQEQQLHRFINAEGKEREALHSREMAGWMHIERQQRDWVEECRLEEQRRELRSLELYEAQQSEYRRERAEVEGAESQKRQRLRISESDERMELAKVESLSCSESQQRERKRLEIEAALLRTLHERQQRPIVNEEMDTRCGMEVEMTVDFDAIFSEYSFGKAELMKPIALTCPLTTRYVMGTSETPCLIGSTFVMKQEFNPYKNNLVAKLQLNVAITDGYTEGDNLGVIATSRRCFNEGCKLVRLGRGLNGISRVAKIQGRTPEQGPFNQDPRLEIEVKREATESGSEHCHNLLRADLVINKNVNPMKELDWLLQKITFLPHCEGWSPSQPLLPREITVSVTLGIAPCPLDDPDLKLYTCTVMRKVILEPIAPFFHLPVPMRHVGYNMTDKLHDGKRAGLPFFSELIGMFPEREAAGSMLSIVLNPVAIEGDRLQMHGQGVEMKYIQSKRPRTIVQHNGHEVGEVVAGSLLHHDDTPYDVLIKLSNTVPLWKVAEVLKSLKFSTQSKYPYRPRRCIECTYTDASFPNHPLTFSCWINLCFNEEIGPNLLCLARTSSLCVIYRNSGQSHESSRFIEAAVTPVTPDGFVENQHSIGVPEYGPSLFQGGTLNFKVEQGVQSGDTLLLRSFHNLLVVDNVDKTVQWRGRRLAKWTSEVGGAHSSGTYEGATSQAWMRLEFVQTNLTEELITVLLRAVCFCNKASRPNPGLRWINITFMSYDAAMPASPPAKAKIGVRVCLPIMTLPQRFLTQKYIENEGNKKFGQFEIPDPVFKDDDMVAVFDGGAIKVEILEGLTSDDQLGLLEDSKAFEIQEFKKQMCFIKMVGCSKPSAMFVPPEPGTSTFSISLGRSSDRRKTLDTSQKKPHTNKIRKKELLSLLKNLYYRNSSEDPDCFKKTLRVTVTDSFSATSQAVIEMPIQAINNKTVVTLPSTDLIYRKGSFEEHTGLQVGGGALFTDPDTADIKEGFISVELASGAAKLDVLDIMPQSAQAAQYNREGIAHRDHVYVTLGPIVDGVQDVKIGGLKVGTFEHKTVSTGAMIRFYIALAQKWPGWQGLPCKSRQGKSSPSSPRAKRVPSLSNFLGGQKLERPFGMKDCSSNKLSFEPIQPPIVKCKRMSVAPPSSPLRPERSDSLQSSSLNVSSQAVVRRQSSIVTTPVYGLPMDAGQLLLRVVVYKNNNDPSSLRPGIRAFSIKVNAGDDVADTKVKLLVNVLPQILSLAPSYNHFVYVEGSDYVPLSTKFKVGIDAKSVIKRGYIMVSIANPVSEEDEVAFHDPYHLHYINVLTKTTGLLCTDIKEVKDPKSQASQTVIAKITQSDTHVKLHFDENTVQPTYKTINQLAKYLCYRNTSAIPNTDITREVNVFVCLSKDAGPYDIEAPPNETTPGYDSCTINTTINIEAVDNPTEIFIPHPCIYYCSPTSGAEPEPLQLVPGVEATDPDTPVFDAPSEIIVQVAGGSRSDMLELNHRTPGNCDDDDDGLSVQDSTLFFEGVPIATIKRDNNNHPACIRLEVDGCPIEALSLILRRVCYRHMNTVKRQLKKIVNLTVKAALPLLPDQKVQPKPTVTRVSMTVVVVPAPFDYSNGVTQKLVQIGRQPVTFLPTSAKYFATTTSEVRFELIRPPVGTRSLPSNTTVIPREFWAPFESVSWEKNLRPPTENDSIRFIPLPPEFQVRESDGKYDIGLKEGKVCVLTLIKKDLVGLDGQMHKACHEVVLQFGNLSKLPVRERDIVRVLRSIAYLQAGESVKGSGVLPAQEV